MKSGTAKKADKDHENGKEKITLLQPVDLNGVQVHKLDHEALDKLMATEPEKKSRHIWEGSNDPVLDVEKIKFKSEELDAKFASTRERLRAFMLRAGQRKTTPPIGQGTGMALPFLEHYLNDAIQLVEFKGVPGVLKRPEHLKPLSRYGLDPGSLM